MHFSLRVIGLTAMFFLICSYGSSGLASDVNYHIHGFLSQGYLYTGTNYFLADTKDGSFEFNEIGLNFRAEPTNNISIALQIFSRDLGPIDNNRVDIDFAFGDYHWRDQLGVRLGRIKTPHGLYHDTIDLDMVRTSVFLPFAVYDPRFRALRMSTDGVTFYGNLPLNVAGAFDYIAYVGINQVDDDIIELLNSPFMEKVITNKGASVYGGRIIWKTPLDGFQFGASFLRAENREVTGPLNEVPYTMMIGTYGSIYPNGTNITVTTDRADVTYYFLEYAFKRLTFSAEYYRYQTEYSYETDQPYDPTIAAIVGFSGFADRESDSGGWYSQLNYQFFDWLTTAVTYSEYYPDWDDKDGDDLPPETDKSLAYQKDLALSLRFDVNEHWNIKLEAHSIDGTAQLYSGVEEDKWNLYAAKTSFYF